MKRVIVMYDKKDGMQRFEFRDVIRIDLEGAFMRIFQQDGQSIIPEHVILGVTITDETERTP